MLQRPPTKRWLSPSGRLDRFTANSMSVPALLALLVFAIGAQVAMTYKIPSPGNDEPAHLGYIGALAAGDLPTIDSPNVDDPERYGDLTDALQGWDEPHSEIWTANHPPLFHLALVPLFNLSDGEPRTVFIAMRLVNTFGFALWILLVGLIARELVPRRPAVPALACLVALMPTLSLRSGFLMNDGVSASGSLLLILMTIRMLRDSVAPDRLAVASLAGVVAAGTRASGALTVAVCAVILLVVVVRREGWRRGLSATALIGGVPAVATGWFYLRNRSLYGDFTGQDALLEKFGRDPVNSVREIAAIPGIDEALITAPIPLLLLGILVPVAALRVGRAGWQWDPAWGLLGVLTGLTSFNLVGFLAAGGGFHDRYLMAIMPLPATLAALALATLGRGRGHAATERREWLVATVSAAALLAWLGGAVWWLEERYIFTRPRDLPVDGALPDLLIGVAVVAGCAIVATLARRVVALKPRGRVTPPPRVTVS